MFVFCRYVKKRTGISHNQERLVCWILILARAALSLVSMMMINVRYFDIVYDIDKVADNNQDNRDRNRLKDLNGEIYYPTYVVLIETGILELGIWY